MRELLRWLLQQVIAAAVVPIALLFWCAYLASVLL